MTDEVKLRSVCEACTMAKVRCNGKIPCERCLKRGIECQYLPFKSRSHNQEPTTAKSSSGKIASKGQAYAQPVSGKTIDRHPMADLTDSMLDANEKKTWSVFFTLYRSFGKGCSQFWFKQQLFKMLRFLEKRSTIEPSAANALVRLRSWMGALGIDIQAPPTCPAPRPPDLRTQNNSLTPSFHATLDDVLRDVTRRNLPMLTVSNDGIVDANEAFSRTFAPSVLQMQQALEDSAGGFLPWAGDLMARILCKESDLILYLQGVANNLDAIGKPPVLPLTQAIPSMNILHVNRKSIGGGEGLQDVLCVVRAVQVLTLEKDAFAVATTIVFDIPDESQTGKVPSKARTFEESGHAENGYGAVVAMSDQTGAEASKMVKELTEIELPPLTDTVVDDDCEWLDNLLSWAAADPELQGNELTSTLPVADEMFTDLHIDGQGNDTSVF